MRLGLGQSPTTTPGVPTVDVETGYTWDFLSKAQFQRDKVIKHLLSCLPLLG